MDEFKAFPSQSLQIPRDGVMWLYLSLREDVEKKSRISVSIGLASSREYPGSSMEELINAALLRSKEAGKNMLTLSR